MGPWDPPSSYSTPLGSPPSHGPRSTTVTLGSPHPSFPLGFPSLMPLPAGHCWVHSCCAAWSAGVEQDTAGLTGVGRAVFSGISQVSGPWGSVGGGEGWGVVGNRSSAWIHLQGLGTIPQPPALIPAHSACRNVNTVSGWGPPSHAGRPPAPISTTSPVLLPVAPSSP